MDLPQTRGSLSIPRLLPELNLNPLKALDREAIQSVAVSLGGRILQQPLNEITIFSCCPQ